MKTKVVEDADLVTYVVVCDPGDEAFSSLVEFARGEKWPRPRSQRSAPSRGPLSAGSTPPPSSTGALQWDEQCELLSLVGDVAEGEDGPSVHAHVVLGLADGTTRGGHLLEAWVYPTLDAVVTETPAHLRKVLRPDIGIALIDLDASEP